MTVVVTRSSPEWPRLFGRVAQQLRAALAEVPVVGIEHVGSTSVPGLLSKPILDIDVIVRRESVEAAIDALARAGYRHGGDLGIPDREAFIAPDDALPRNVYVCAEGSLPLRNHLAVRDVLRTDPELRDRYAAVKVALCQDPETTIEAYIAGKSAVLAEILAAGGLDAEDRRRILRANTGH